MLTIDADGTNTSNGNGPLNSFTYDPFGNILPGGNNPDNTLNGSYGFGGSRERLTETSLASAPVQMGTRVYLPSLGRFTQVDPVPGGNANDYVYVLDPINASDYSGQFSLSSIVRTAATLAISIVLRVSMPVARQVISVASSVVNHVCSSGCHLAPSTKGAAKVQNNSTRMPVATVKPSAARQVAPRSLSLSEGWSSIPKPSGGPELDNEVRNGWIKAGSAGIGCIEGVGIVLLLGPEAWIGGCGLGGLEGYNTGEGITRILDGIDALNSLLR